MGGGGRCAVRGQVSRTQTLSADSELNGVSGDKNRSLPFVSTWDQARSNPGPDCQRPLAIHSLTP